MIGHFAERTRKGSGYGSIESLSFPRIACARGRRKCVGEMPGGLAIAGVAIGDLREVTDEAESTRFPHEAAIARRQHRLKERHILEVRCRLVEVEESADPVEAIAEGRADELQLLRPLALMEVQLLLGYRVGRGQKAIAGVSLESAVCRDAAHVDAPGLPVERQGSTPVVVIGDIARARPGIVRIWGNPAAVYRREPLAGQESVVCGQWRTGRIDVNQGLEARMAALL